MSAIRESNSESNSGWKPDNQTWLTASKATLEGGEATINDYFRANPGQVLGEMSVGHGMYNRQDLRVRSDGELAAALHAAIDGLPEGIVTGRTAPLPAAPSLKLDPDLPVGLKEGSFFIAEGQRIMQVIGGHPTPVMLRDKPLMASGTPGGKRLGALIRLRDRARDVLKAQQEGRPEEERDAARTHLRLAYNGFTAQFGPINKTTLSERQDGTVTRRMPNVLRFRTDPDVYLVMALEHYDERTATARPAAIMERDVVTAARPVTAVDSAKDGLLASLNHLGCVDIPYIASLYGRSESEVVEELEGLIFFDPALDAYVPADEYLSGNVRQKLRFAEASGDSRARGNAEALTAVQPEELVAEEIDVALGTPWIPAGDVQAFLVETLQADGVRVSYVNKEALWKVRVGSSVRTSAAAISEYGTEDVDAYALAEQALNMRTPTVRRRVPGGPGESDTFVVDQEATLAAREKQAELKTRFSEWAFEDPDRSKRLVAFYNEHFNNLRLREFDGSHLTFPRMSAAITMREHQKDAIWRNMSSGNTLYAHVVGAGKTFTMVASGMEMRRTGLAKKPLYVVPNHMLEQFAREFLVLYPDADLLVATKQDLTKQRRQLLKARMATGEWDGIVMTHSSFEKIAMSPGFQARFLDRQVAEYEELLLGVEDRSLKRNITKRVEKLKAARKEKVKEMAASGRKDGGLCFDELGIDQVFIDEAHMFKNLETPTKMDRVAGIQTGGSQRAFDLLMKARYLHSRTPGRGLTFATGTPVSNSLGEMYTMMRYLMPDLLAERGIEHFDAWAAAFGEVINSLEISPDGQSLRVNSRFAKFKNLPELLSLFRLSADVQTGSMLKLPVPELAGGKPQIVASPMSDSQDTIQRTLVARYERVRAGGVDPREDNALKIITDGRKLALDARLVDPEAEDNPGSKINQLVGKVYDIWERTRAQRSTQMIFSDLGVSPTGWGFCVYDDIMDKLEARGIPRAEIAAIGDAGTDVKKEALFSTVRSGRVRILLGSTSKMGTGTNVQERLYALHHVDPPWRPADIEQREGRILRQGNGNREVEIYRYVTEGSFDAFMWQTLETKAKFIAQAMAGDAGCRRADDIGGAELSFAEVKAIATGNPAMLVMAEMDLDVRQLTLLRKAHLRDQAKIAAELERLPQQIGRHGGRIALLEKDIARRSDTKGDAFVMQVGDRVIRPEKGEKRTARLRAQDALALAVAKAQVASLGAPMPWERKLGTLGGLDVVMKADIDHLSKSGRFSVALEGAGTYDVARIENPKHCPALIQGLESALRSFDGKLAKYRAESDKWQADLARYRKRAGRPFPSEGVYQELVPLRDRLKALLQQQEIKSAKPEASRAEEPQATTACPPGKGRKDSILAPESIDDGVRGNASHDGKGRHAQVGAQPHVPKQQSCVEPFDELPHAALQAASRHGRLSAISEGQHTDHAGVGAGEQQNPPIHQQIREIIDAYRGLQLHADEPATEQAGPDGERMEEPQATTSDQVGAQPARRLSAIEETWPSDAVHAGDEAAIGTPFADDAIAIVSQMDADGIDWFSLAVKVPERDSWNIQSIYPLFPHRERRVWEPRRKGYGWQDGGWVRTHLAAEDAIPDLGQHLSEGELARLIPAQREIAESVEVNHPDATTTVLTSELVHDDGQVEAHETAEVEQSPPSATRPIQAPRPSDRGKKSTETTGRGQLGLFETVPPSTPETIPSSRVSQPISSHPVQMGLFEAPPEKPARKTIARSYRPAAFEVRAASKPPEPSAMPHRGGKQGSEASGPEAGGIQTIAEDEWTAADEALFQAEMEARAKLSRDDPLYIDPDPGAHDAEVAQWQRSLSTGEEHDMQDLLETGGHAGAPEPTERAVLGRFTQLVGDRPQLAGIVHDAVEHFEPYGSMVARIERETGGSGPRRLAEERATRSLYNATLARKTGHGDVMR